MATVTAVSASPMGAGVSRIVPTIDNPTSTSTVTVSLDGSAVPLAITVGERLSYSVEPADVGKPGCVVAVVDRGGTLSVNSDGTFTFTAG